MTAVTRVDSQAAIPDGLKVARVNYDDETSLVEALKGQEVLIITMGVRAPENQQMKLIEAAGKAGVPWILPNEWGADTRRETITREALLGDSKDKTRQRIVDLGSSWIGIDSGFWYEFSLGGGPDRYGFDFKNQSVVFFDDGLTPLNTSTWPQSGRAVANLLALPVHHDPHQQDGDGKSAAALSDFKNKFVHINSFQVTQKDMFASVLRVTGTQESDWKISYEDSRERYQGGMKEFQAGNFNGFARCMYTRMFYPDGSGILAPGEVLHNNVLGLSEEDVDEYTKIALEQSKASSATPGY